MAPQDRLSLVHGFLLPAMQPTINLNPHHTLLGVEPPHAVTSHAPHHMGVLVLYIHQPHVCMSPSSSRLAHLY